MEIADLSEDKMAYTVTVTYVFENVEANTPEEAEALVDGISVHNFVQHPTNQWIISTS